MTASIRMGAAVLAAALAGAAMAEPVKWGDPYDRLLVAPGVAVVTLTDDQVELEQGLVGLALALRGVRIIGPFGFEPLVGQIRL